MSSSEISNIIEFKFSTSADPCKLLSEYCVTSLISFNKNIKNILGEKYKDRDISCCGSVYNYDRYNNKPLFDFKGIPQKFFHILIGNIAKQYSDQSGVLYELVELLHKNYFGLIDKDYFGYCVPANNLSLEESTKIRYEGCEHIFKNTSIEKAVLENYEKIGISDLSNEKLCKILDIISFVVLQPYLVTSTTATPTLQYIISSLLSLVYNQKFEHITLLQQILRRIHTMANAKSKTTTSKKVETTIDIDDFENKLDVGKIDMNKVSL